MGPRKKKSCGRELAERLNSFASGATKDNKQWQKVSINLNILLTNGITESNLKYRYYTRFNFFFFS